MTGRLKTVRVASGHFNVFWDGAETPFLIINGSRGGGGTGRTMYGFVKRDLTGTAGSYTWIGSLQACKNVLASLLKNAVMPQ